MRIESMERDGWLVLSLRHGHEVTGTGALSDVMSLFVTRPFLGLHVDLATEWVDPVTLCLVQATRDMACQLGRRFQLSGRDTILPLDDIAADDLAADWAGIAPVRVGAPDRDRILAGLLQPCRGFFELGEDGQAGIGARCLDALRHGGIAVSVSTATAFELDLAQTFDGAILQRGWRDDGEIGGLTSLCLAEAVGNAVVHGNLGIVGGMRSNREGFIRFQRLMAERLADPALASRRVEISLHRRTDSVEVAVADHGDGFDFDAKLARDENTGNMQGRGLSLIRKAARRVWAEEGGRVIVMDFHFPNQQLEIAG